MVLVGRLWNLCPACLNNFLKDLLTELYSLFGCQRDQEVTRFTVNACFVTEELAKLLSYIHRRVYT